jgi:hypothetical protein
MKIAILGALVMLFSLPAHAQAHATPGGASAAAGYVSGGGGSAGGSASSPAMMHTPATRFDFGYAHGTDCDFTPSSFMAYDDAIKLGRSIVEAKPKTLGEVAAEYRARKKQPS